MAPIAARNPRTGEIDYRVEPATAEELAATADRLRAGQQAWRETPLHHRLHAMATWRDAIAASRAELVDALVADTGRLTESELEVDVVVGHLTRWIDAAPDLLAEPPPRQSSVPVVEVEQDTHPYGLVGVISPWNFPLLLSLIDAIPALVAGCAVAVKPSEVTPRFVEPLRRCIAEVPELGDVLGYVVGAGETGASLVDVSDLVCFTGSVATGRKVAEQAARRFIPAFLELGGKDAAVVTASADVERATSAILWGATANAGQSCLSIERIYVERPIAERFATRLADKARSVRLAHPRPEDGQVGPIIAERQVGVIERHLADACRKGAKALVGGSIERIDGGAWCRPTVLVGVDHSMLVMTDETFGPVMPVMAVDDVDAAVAAANDSAYGLSAAVFAGSVAEASKIGRRLEAGAVSINDAALTAVVHDGEKHAFKQSGLGGTRMGPAAIKRFGRRRAFLTRVGSGRDSWWYDEEA